MKTKIFLTSVIAIGFAANVFAETFPTDGFMQENKTYENAATYSNMGAYDGTVTATAEYENVLYDVPAGTYLPAASEVVAPCTAGNYCVGMADLLYSETESQGLTACPTTYPNSDEGASVDTQCYTACTLEGANIPHATEVDGNDYFGTGTDTCGATACENGYHVKSGGVNLVKKTPLIPSDYREETTGKVTRDLDGSYADHQANGFEFETLTENNTWGSHFSYGTVYGRASCQPIAHPNNDIIQYVSSRSSYVLHGGQPIAEFEAELATIADTTTTKLVVQMLSQVREQQIDWYDYNSAINVLLAKENDVNYTTTSTGDYCYCQITHFVSNDGIKQNVEAAPWVYMAGRGPGPGCSDDCVYRCAGDKVTNAGYAFAAMYDSLDVLYGSICEANTINITWSDADQADIDANNAGACEYDGDIRTPVKAIKKPGKTFKGWKFQK